MTEQTRPALLLDDGSIASLVACLLQTDAGEVTVLFPEDAAPAARSRLRALERRVDLLGLAEILRTPVASLDSECLETAVQQGSTQLLLEAATQAIRRGASRLIWPCCFDADLDRISRASDKAMLLGRLLEMDLPSTGPGSSFEIETPLIDLSDAQIADLARDLDAPLGGAWWCQRDGEHACGECPACRRWIPLLSPVRTPIAEKSASMGSASL